MTTHVKTHPQTSRPSRAPHSIAAMAAALACLAAVMATTATALTPLTPLTPPPVQGSSTNPHDAADCTGRGAQLGAASAAPAPITGAGTTGLYAQNATRGATMATTRSARPAAFGNGYVGSAGVSYAGGAYVGAPGFGRLAAASAGTAEPAAPSQRAQRMLALEPGQAGSAAAQSNCLAGHANGVR